MDTIATFLCLPHMWMVFVGCLLALFAYGLWNFPRIDSVIEEILDASKKLPSLDSSSNSQDVHRRLQREFYKKFESFNLTVSAKPSLGRAWDEFVESTIPDPDNERYIVTQRPDHYFHRDVVLQSKLNIPQLFAMANYLTGLGLFFTFVGIAAALHIAQAGLANPDGGHKAMQDLLAVASTKFISSLFGIILSLAFSVSLRWKMKQLQMALEHFCNVIEAETAYKSTAEFLFENQKESKVQTLALTDMAEKISEGITSALANKLPASVAAALEPLAQEIRGLAAKFSSSNEDALQNVLQEFLNQMRSSTGKDMDALVSSISILRTSLDELIGNMRALSDNFGSETKASTSRLSESLDTFANTFAPIEKGISQFGQTLGALESMASKIESAGGNFSGAADANNESVSRLAEKMVEISSQMAPIQQMLEGMAGALSKMSDTASQLQTAGQTIFSAAGDMKHSAASIESAETQFSSKVQTFASIAGGISETVLTLEQASNSVSAAAQPLNTVTAEMSAMLEQIQESERRLVQNQAEMNRLLNEMQKYSEIIPSLWQQYESRFRDIDSDLANAFGELANGSEKFRSSVETYVRDVDEKFSHSLDKLSGVIREFTEERESSLVVREVSVGQ